MLQWLGNVFYAQEAVRRAATEFACNPLNCFVCRDATHSGSENVLRYMISDGVIALYVATSGVRLDPEQATILQQN